MSKQTAINSQLVKKMATLASIPVSDQVAQKLATGFSETLTTIDNLQSVDIKKVEPTHQVTGLENVLREDVTHPEQSFTQSEALANAKHTHAGYFVVPRVLDQKDA